MARDRPPPYGNPPVGAVSNRAYRKPHSVSPELDLFGLRRARTTEGNGNRSAGACPPRSWQGEGNPLACACGMRGPSPYGNRPVGAVSNRAYGKPHSVSPELDLFGLRRARTTEGNEP